MIDFNRVIECRFVPVALADGYSTYADLSYYLQRYPGAVGAPCGALARYLPAPCSFAGGADWRPGGEVRPVTELSGASSSSSGAGWSRPGRAMHDDRGLLPLAGVEAAAASTSGSASPSTSAASTSVGPKLEAGAAGFCPLDAPFPGRCLPGNCSCSGQRTLHCPKNVLAGPLTGNSLSLVLST